MLRPAIVVGLCGLAAPAGAGELPRMMGMYPTQGGAPLAMLDSEIHVAVHGAMVEADLTQTFRNDADHATEATYIFPLPADAAVSAMAIDTGSEQVRAQIARRGEAQRRYEEAVAAGVAAGLLDQERPDVFTQTISAIPAHGSVAVTLRFDCIASYRDGTWQLVLPLVVAPRFVPGSSSGRPTTGTGRSPDTERAPDASRVTPVAAPGAGGPTRITLELDGASDVTSPSHELAASGDAYTLTDPHSDHDAIVRWRSKLPAAGWVEQDDDSGYAAVVLAAPPAGKRSAPVRALLVVDRAATTRGDADAVEHPLVHALLGALDASDRAAITGSDRIDWRAPDQALRAIDEAWSHPAGPLDLSRLLGGTRAEGAAVVLVSDGLVADDRAVIAAARAVGAPIHVIGVGPAPNRSLLAAIAGATGGTLRFAGPGDDLAALARDVIADLAAPPAPLEVTWGTLAASDVEPATLPRLGSGQTALVVAKVRRAHTANARAGGDVFALATIDTARRPEGAVTPRGPLARRWSRMRLDDLIAAGNPRAIEAHALRYGLVSPLTSMVAIGDEVVVRGGVQRTVPVPVSVPAGMRWQAVHDQLEVGKRPVQHEPFETRSDDEDAKPSKRKSNAEESEGERPRLRRDAGDDDSGGEAGAASKAPAAAPPPEVVSSLEPAPDVGEELVVAGRAADERTHRFALALSGGLAIEHHASDGVVALTGRYERGGATLLGVEGGAWLVGGLHLQADLLATFVRRGLGWFEAGGGLGVHFGDGGVGPALDLTLRVRLPHLKPFLRYDGALLFHDGTRDGQNTTSIGIEADF
ncbi:MAG TPA: VIT domain-containing protein [Kofleriaceae bacterium]|nr:VIT domain-containing protein [Kofleriaceae bacterium]